MEGIDHGTAEATVDPVARPVGIVNGEAKQQASKEHTKPGSPSTQRTVWCGDGGGKGGRGASGAALPGWKLDCLCRESGLPPAMKSGFLCF